MSTENAFTPDIPPTTIVREQLGALVRETAKTRRLLRLAQQRDKLLSTFDDALTMKTSPANEREVPK